MTPEELSREAAEGVFKRSTDDGGEPTLWAFGLHSWRPKAEHWQGDEGAKAWLDDHLVPFLTDRLRLLVLAAIERALASAPVPGGLSEERLAWIRKARHEVGDYEWHPEQTGAAIDDLLAHVEHLTRALHDCGDSCDGTAGIWSRGYEAGLAAGKAEGVVAERERCVRLAAEMAGDHPVACAGGDTIARAIEEG